MLNFIFAYVSRDEIIENICSSKEYILICKRIARSNKLYKDLYQELMVVLLEQDKAKIEKIYSDGYLNFFIVSVLKRLVKERARKYNGLYYLSDKCSDNCDLNVIDEEYDYEIDYKAGRIRKAIEKMKTKDETFYRSHLFEEYLEAGSVRKLAMKTGIPYKSIHNSIKEFRQELKYLKLV